MALPKNYIFCIAIVAGCCSCKSVPKPTRPMESYDAAPIYEQVSAIHIPLRIYVADMERSINQSIQGVIYEDKNPDDGDNLAIRVEKKDKISFGVSGKDIQYQIPLNISFKYKAGITYLSGTAEIAIRFRTGFDIRSDWSISTATDIESYEWLQKPRIQVGGIQIPIGFIGDVVMKNSRKTITASIDQVFKSKFNLRDRMELAWKRMFAPELLSESYKTWLLIHPQGITMTPLEMNTQMISATIMVQSMPRLHLGAAPAPLTPTTLPKFQLSPATHQGFVVFLEAEIPFTEAERIAREHLQGETFSAGNRSVTLEDIELFGKGNTLIVNTQLSGSYNGNIYLEGRPYFNLQSNAIDISDLNFTLDTENFLHKTAGWLLKSNLKRTIQENLDFFLDTNLKTLHNELQGQLDHYQVSQDIAMKGKLHELQIHHAYLAPDAIKVHVGMRGNIEVHVKGME